MLLATQENRDEMQSLLNTALRIRNERLESRFNMQTFVSWIENGWTCDTTACLAGWHVHFANPDKPARVLESMAGKFADVFPRELYPHFVTGHGWSLAQEQGSKAEDVLFGGERGHGSKALDRQIRTIRWFLHRIDIRLEYDRIQALPKRERRLAA